MTLHESPPGPPERPEPSRQPEPEPHGHMPHRTPREVPRSWKTYVVIALLVGVPLVFLWTAAQVSRDSGRDKAEKAGYTELHEGWPPRLLRRIYQVPVPGGASHIRYYEENALHTSSFYVDFTCGPDALEEYLDTTSERTGDRPLPELEAGRDPVTTEQARTVGWSFADGEWSGLKLKQPGERPDLSIAVNTADPERLVVRTVSTTEY